MHVPLPCIKCRQALVHHPDITLHRHAVARPMLACRRAGGGDDTASLGVHPGSLQVKSGECSRINRTLLPLPLSPRAEREFLPFAARSCSLQTWERAGPPRRLSDSATFVLRCSLTALLRERQEAEGFGGQKSCSGRVQCKVVAQPLSPCPVVPRCSRHRLIHPCRTKPQRQLFWEHVHARKSNRTFDGSVPLQGILSRAISCLDHQCGDILVSYKIHPIHCAQPQLPGGRGRGGGASRASSGLLELLGSSREDPIGPAHTARGCRCGPAVFFSISLSLSNIGMYGVKRETGLRKGIYEEGNGSSVAIPDTGPGVPGPWEGLISFSICQVVHFALLLLSRI